MPGGYIEIAIKTTKREETIDITARINQVIKESSTDTGTCTVFVPHTTCGITINECADPDVTRDMLHALAVLVPHNGSYTHGEGNADAHVKASLIGSSVTCSTANTKLCLGTWQGVFLCEFDGPRTRNVWIRVD